MPTRTLSTASTPDILTPRLRLIAITPQRLSLQKRNPQRLGDALNAIIPPGWPGPDFDDAAYAFIRRQWRTHPHTLGWHRYVLLPHPEPTLIGGLGSHPLSSHEAEVGYSILPPWQRQGYATEATQALIAFLFANGNTRVSAQTYPNLTASLRVMANCGMHHVGAGQEAGCVSYAVDRDP